MINRILVIWFDGDLFAVIQVRDEYTANDKNILRRVTKLDGHYYVKIDKQVHNIDDEVSYYYRKQEIQKKMEDWYKATGC